MKLISHTPAFASPVFSFSVDEPDSLNALLRSECMAMMAKEAGVVRSNQHGWHSKNELFNSSEPGMRALAKDVIRAISFATKTVAPEFDRNVHNIQAEGWVNINQKGAYNTPHDHPGYQWSGCYYVQQPKVEKGRSGMIEFLDPRTTPRDMSVLKAVSFAQKFQLRPKAGTLLVFPSYLMHWVYPNETDDTRISIAFNGRYVPKRQVAVDATTAKALPGTVKALPGGAPQVTPLDQADPIPAEPEPTKT